MKKLCVKVMLLGLVITTTDVNAEDQKTTGSYKSENRSFYSIIEKSSSTGEGIDKEVFQQTSESITNKKRFKVDNEVTPQKASLLSPQQNQWLNNKPHGEYFDDKMRLQKSQYRLAAEGNDREFKSIQAQVAKAAIDMNSTPYYKKEHVNEQKALQNQLASMSKSIKEEEKKITRELDSLSKELAVTSRKISTTDGTSDAAITNQLAVSSRLAGHRYETPDDYVVKQLTVSSKAMQRNNRFYPDSLGATDMNKLIKASDSIDNGKKKTLNEVLNEIFTRKPKTPPAKSPAPVKPLPPRVSFNYSDEIQHAVEKIS